MNSDPRALDFSVAMYSGDRKTGSVAVITRHNGRTQVTILPTGPESGLDKLRKPVFVGLTEDDRFLLLDPQTKTLGVQPRFPADAFPAHIYPEPGSNRDWFMNDGEKETGNDTVNCGDKGSSVSVVENTASSNAKFLKTLCIGRGHHQAEFVAPDAMQRDMPRRAYVSNLVDGTISVIANDPSDKAGYLTLTDTINLCEPEKEDSGQSTVPNKAFPHGLVYSPHAGKLFCLNNGYGTIAVIDPRTSRIEKRIGFKGHSNLFGTPDGRYLLGRGADRKSDPEHVIAKLSVFDTVSEEIVYSTELRDIYLSKYFFNPEGSRLYFTSGVSGSPEQQKNLKSDAFLIVDVTALPRLNLCSELRLGSSAGTVDFLADEVGTRLVFVSNSEAGAVTLVDGRTDQHLEDIPVNGGNSHSRLWTLKR